VGTGLLDVSTQWTADLFFLAGWLSPVEATKQDIKAAYEIKAKKLNEAGLALRD
jgi:hypothetical protein